MMRIPDEFSVNIGPDEPVYIISIVSDLVAIPIWTLRKLDEFGVVCPKRVGKKTRCYSRRQVELLQFVHHLMEEKGVNISGIKIILEMQEEQEE